MFRYVSWLATTPTPAPVLRDRHGPAAIRDWADIERVPMVDKALLRTVPTQELMTGSTTPELVHIATSGSSGEPFVIYQTRIEQYTSHVSVFAMLLGARLADLLAEPRLPHLRAYFLQAPTITRQNVRIRKEYQTAVAGSWADILKVYRSFNGQDVMKCLAAAVIGRREQ